MKKEKDLPLLEEPEKIILEGVTQRIIFHNPDNGFSVLKLENAATETGGMKKKLVDEQIAVGHLMAPRPNMHLRMVGKFVNNAKFGRQFSFEKCEEILPTEEKDIRNYLGSGIIKGIGPAIAKRIVDKLGKDTLRLIDENPENLRGVKGVTEKIIGTVKASWEAASAMRELMLFLQPHGISNAYASRIYQAYGLEAKKIVRENPYRLAMDIRGIGFITADSIAAKLGFEKNHPLRVAAGVIYILTRASEEGHVYLLRDELAGQMEKQLECDAAQTNSAIAALEKSGNLVIEQNEEDREAPERIYLKRFHHCEAQTAFYLTRLLNSPKTARFKNPEEVVAEVAGAQPITLAPEQIKAVEASARDKVLVVTGGPGTGKTTIIKTIIQVFDRLKAKILLAAPTGRAAKRMTETCGREGRTVHRLLEYSPREDRFLRNEENPLACHLLIVDESSMMDTQLFYYLLKAVPLGATLVLVGDVSQLPSVGPGNVLADVIESGAARVIRLNEIFRQSAESQIISNAHLINRGQMPQMESHAGRSSDFFFMARDDVEEAAGLIIDLAKNRLPNHFGFDPVNDIQILTPMRKGTVGADNMNRLLQDALNPHGLEIRRGEKFFRLHDKVMQIRNNYDKDVYNGDIGRISFIQPKEKTLLVDFDGDVVGYDFDELDELVPSYAISIHKSQGSEYPAVIIPLMMQHYVLLQRNLIYTAVTRAKKLVVLVGERKALHIAIQNNNTRKRNTWLAKRLALPVF